MGLSLQRTYGDAGQHHRRVTGIAILTGCIPEEGVFRIWQSYRVWVWPTTYLIDKEGRIRFQHVGEGKYAERERLVNQLLAEE